MSSPAFRLKGAPSLLMGVGNGRTLVHFCLLPLSSSSFLPGWIWLKPWLALDRSSFIFSLVGVFPDLWTYLPIQVLGMTGGDWGPFLLDSRIFVRSQQWIYTNDAYLFSNSPWTPGYKYYHTCTINEELRQLKIEGTLKRISSSLHIL